MASPTPGIPPVLEPKPLEPVMDEEQKSELNGHATFESSQFKPQAETAHQPTTETEKPIINGGAKMDDPVVANGVATSDVKVEGEDRGNASSAVDPESERRDPQSEVKPEEPPVSRQPVAETAPVQPDDIEMADASADEQPKPEVVEAPIVAAPTVEAPVIEALVVEAPVVAAPVVESPPIGAPVVEVEVVETSVTEAPLVEAPVSEAPVVEKTVIEMDEAPATETTVVETLTVETPAVEATSPKEPAVVQPAAEELRAEASPPVPAAPSVGTESAAPKSEPPVSPGADKTAPPEEGIPTSEVDLQPASMSQLAIETTEMDISPVQASVEVSMPDAPSFKVAREREDDLEGEPAPKRARTEPKEEEAAVLPMEAAPADSTPVETTQPDDSTVQVATSGTVAGMDGEAPSLASLRWDDAEKDAKTITAYQRREIRKVIGRIKKTKQGANFRDSVQKLWPALWDSYSAKIEKPMDLAEIDRGMREPDGPYMTFGGLKRDLALIFTNTLAFNGPAHDVTHGALNSIKAAWDDISRLPEEEPPRPKPVPKSKPVRESRAVVTSSAPTTAEASTRRQSAGVAASPGAASETKPQTQEKPADLRRASTTTDGDRPKRTVRAPKPKDIDYTTKPSRKKLKPELQFCDEVLGELLSPKYKELTQWFRDAVDAEGLGIPQYYSVVKKPMDLGKVSAMLAAGDITSLKDFDKNMKLIVSNCYLFNGPPDQGNEVALMAQQLEGTYNSLMKGKDAWLAKHAKANAPPPSNDSDEDEDEEEDAEGEDAPVVDHSKEIRELEAKCQEESAKLTQLCLDNPPNQSLIKVQQSIVTMIQDELVKAKQSAADPKQKPDKPGKKASKGTKAKAAGGAAGRRASGAAHPKKTGGTKKPAAKKSLNAADKDQIANAINDLEYPHLDRAIEIIKRDTGQAENNDGELELDIDQLSNDALLKLWELCKKVLPGFGKDSAAAPNSSPEVNRGASAKQAPKTAAKPRKNKPMSAQEQEEKIAQLRNMRELYHGKGQEPGGMEVTQAPTPTAESSEESSSEEE